MSDTTKLYVMVTVWAFLIALLLTGCVSPAEQAEQQRAYMAQFPDPVCRYEADRATVTMGCTGCIYANIDRIVAWRNIYQSCSTAKSFVR